MISMMHMPPRLGPLTIPPVTADIKLKAINKFHLDTKLSPVNSLPPAQITLTPAAPSMGGQNYLYVVGYYRTQPGSTSISGWSSDDYIASFFATAKGKTCLLDVGISGPNAWTYYLWGGEGADS